MTKIITEEWNYLEHHYSTETLQATNGSYTYTTKFSSRHIKKAK